MPKETVHYGRDFAFITVPATKEHSAYEYELDANEARLGLAEDGLNAEHVRFDTKPRLDVLWSRPIDMQSLPIGEDAVGAVQVQIVASANEMRRRIDHVTERPEDLEHSGIVFTEPLTRGQLNHLIRTLKRARDAAFGADE
ncbi:MAG TPA: hypothetical protein PK890_08760 [Terrimesophilobacter sp.]|nr:hypothetical protein [Terrimesophilobacter sp.]